MEEYGIEQYIKDDIEIGNSLTEAIDRAFYDLYEVFCNSIRRHQFGDDVYLEENEVLAKLEQCFKRKYE